jgi:uncharacterized protein (DUF885 family)
MTTDQTSSPQVADLAERALRQLLSAEPLEGTLLGFREYDALLADISVEAEQRMSAERAALRAEAEAIDPATLTQQDAITVSLIITQSHYADAAQAAGAIEYTATAFPVTPASSLLAFLRMIVLTNAEQAAAYLVRLREIPRYLAQAEDRLTAGRTAGLLPVAHLVTMSIDQIDRFLATEPCPLDLAAPADWSAATEWKAQCAAVIDDVVKPAFRRHRDVLEADVLPTARDRDEVGLLHLPGGLDRYAGLVRLHTTTDRTPEELHQVGLDMVALIHEEFSALGATLFGLTDVRAIFEHLNNDPALRWSTSQEILDAAEKPFAEPRPLRSTGSAGFPSPSAPSRRSPSSRPRARPPPTTCSPHSTARARAPTTRT